MAGVLTISARGGGDPVRVDHWGAYPSWVLSDAGRFRCSLTAETARALDLGGAAAAGTRWVRYRSPGLPDWGGVVTAPVWRDDGTLELGCESFHVLLRKRRVPRVYGQQSAPAGALALRAFTDVQADDYTFITTFEADEWGDPVKWDWRGGDLKDDVLRGLVTASNQEWTVDADRNAEWRVRIGQDKTASVKLWAPLEIVAWEHRADLWTVVNDIEGVAADQRYERSAHATYQHTDSVRTLGRYQDSRRYAGVVNKATLRPKISRDLHRSAWPAEVIDLTTVNVGMGWERYVVGDSVQVVLPGSDAVRRVRIGARAVDIDAGTERLACEVEFERDGW
jgi:hypothetical protein